MSCVQALLIPIYSIRWRVFIDFSATNKCDNLACLMLFLQSDGAIFNFFYMINHR